METRKVEISPIMILASGVITIHKGKGKVALVPFLTEHHAMKTY
jgi:hypothetical protein